MAFRDVVRTISLALDVAEGGKLHHAARVALLAYKTGQALGLAEVAPLYYAGLLHDLGAIGIDGNLLDHAKTGFEQEEARLHTENGVHIVRPIAVLRPFEDMIRDHHERHDGTGFPTRKRGADISIGASIIRIADELDVATYGSGVRDPRVIAELILRRERGTGVPARVADAAAVVLRDPEVIAAFEDDTELERTTAALCPNPPGLESVTRSDLLSQLLWVLARVVDAKHKYTMGHSTRVAYFGFRIAQAFSDAVNPWDVAWAGLLHDVGKIGVPRRLLDKRGPLEADERRAIQLHAFDSQRIVASIRDLAHLAMPAASHHERYDGKGYPGRLAAEGIPLIGRILAYADVYDAVTSARAYRSPMPHGEALSLVRGMVGTALDPHLQAAAMDALRRWGPTGGDGDHELPFTRFFETDDADLDRTFGREAGSGTMLRAAPRASMLAALEPWTRVEMTTWGVLAGDLDGLERITGAQRGRHLADFLNADSTHALVDATRTLSLGDTFTQYVFTKDGKPLEVLLQRLGSDVTLLLRSAEGRLQSMERLALFYRNFLSSSEAVVFADPEGRIIDVNESFLGLFGYAREEVVGQHTRILQSGRQDKAFYSSLWSSLLDPARGYWSGEIVDRKKSGEEVELRLTIESVRAPSGECVGYLAHQVDISAQKRADAELRLHKEELLRANEGLLRLSRFKDDLIAMTSHDLRGPLAALGNAAELLRQNLARLSSDSVATRLLQIRDTASRLTDFVSDLLDLERTESGRLELRPCRLGLAALLAHCIDHAQMATTKRLRVELEGADLATQVIGDPMRLEQVFMNLLTNAMKFSPEGSTVTLRLSHDEANERLLVDVDDEGPGIPEDALEAIFDRYYQVQTKRAVTTRGFGTGLGLNIVRNILTLHGGKVHAQNRSGGGCRFRVELPERRGDAMLSRLVVVILARWSAETEELIGRLEELGAQPLWIDTAGRLASVCTLTDADVVLYEDAIADPSAREFLARERDGGRRLTVRLSELGDTYPSLEEQTLSSPILDSELREVLREAAVRRREASAPHDASLEQGHDDASSGRRRSVAPAGEP